jgi:hypothetical protein
MADRSLNALMERLGFSGDGTPHGMRAAFSTHFNGIGASADVIEHCLAHVAGNRVRAAYNRHAYQDERRKMLQSWANHVDKLKRADSGGSRSRNASTQARLTAEAGLARSTSSAR